MFGKLAHLGILAVEDLCDFHTGKVLRQIRVDVRSTVFYFPVCSSREFAENNREQHDKRHEAEHHQRQLIVQKQHRNQNTDDHEEVLQKIDQKVGEHQRNRVRIVCRSRDKLSDRNLI